MSIISQHFSNNTGRSNQGHSHHSHSSITQPNLTAFWLTHGIPLPMLLQGGTVWGLDWGPGTSESKNSSHMALPAFYSLACKGGLWLNSKNRKSWGFFFQFFWRENMRRRNGKEFRWFLFSTWLKHRKRQYLLREMYGYVLSVELRVMFLSMGM